MSRHVQNLLFFPIAAVCSLTAACTSSTGIARDPAGQMSAQSREHVAAAAEASGNSDLALAMYAEASAAAPTNSDARLRYADMLVRVGKIDMARDLLTRGLANTSDPMMVRHGLGVIDVMAGLHSQAITELDKILAVQPKDVPALVDKAVALDLVGKHAEAQVLYLKAREILPQDPAIANDFALSLALQGRIADARAVLSPFKDAEALPDRMKVTMEILNNAADPGGLARGANSGGRTEEIKRLALALADGGRGNVTETRGQRR